MSLVIAGERSGVGKTTVTLTLLASLRHRQLRVQSFKVGPDYIDPMFHQYVTGRASRNLDPVLTSETYIQQCFTQHIQDVEYALVEGVMGLFDGVRQQGSRGEVLPSLGYAAEISTGYRVEDTAHRADFASTAHIARLLNLPVLLVLDCSRLSGSIAAIAHGYRSFDPRIQLCGVVLNRVGSDRHLELLQDALEPLQLPVLGVLRRQDNITIPDRHLGLVPTAEISQLNVLIDQLAQLGDSCFDWDQLLPLLRKQDQGSSRVSPPVTVQLTIQAPAQPKIAIAYDRAFSFYYQDNLDCLDMGAELVFWSPLTDATLPQGVQGLYFGGGFPEVFAEELFTNSPARESVRQAISAGMPTYAECGGLMYLCEQIVDFEGKSWQMAGVLPTSAVMGSRLTLGYRQAVALQESPLLSAGTMVWGHEFHRSSLSLKPQAPLFEAWGMQKKQDYPVLEGWRLHQLHASYVHLHFGARPDLATRFLQHCQQYLS